VFLVEYILSTRKEVVMEKRYENSLKDVLEEVAFEGHAVVSKWRLTKWYGQTNFTVGIRRDLRERWKSLLVDELSCEPTILKIAEAGGDVVLVNNSNFYKNNE
jgi:hypothetical protein